MNVFAIKKQLLYAPHEDKEEVYILKKGEVTLYTSKNGKRLVLDVLGPDSIFGHLAPKPREMDHFAEVTEEAYVCVIPLNHFSLLIGQKPKILLNLLNILANQIQDYQHRLKISAMTAEEKVIAFLESRDKPNGSSLSKWFPRGKLTHAKIADQTGLSRETVSRTISLLRKTGKL